MLREVTKNTVIYLMRHAKPVVPFGGRAYYGASDYPLSQEGITAAKKVGDQINIKFDSVFASNMTRALHTAELVVPKAKVNVISELREINMGDWEGRSYDEVREEFKEIYEKRGCDFGHTAPPNGESFCEVQKRALAAFQKIIGEHGGEKILIIAHGCVIWTLFAHYFNIDINNMMFYRQEYCGTHIFENAAYGMKLIRYNWMPVL